MSIRTVLVVFKKSAYQIYVRERKEAHIGRLLRGRHPAVSHMKQVDADQRRSTRAVVRVLEARGLSFTMRYRAEIPSTRGYDLVISVGGDGTLLEASHFVAGTPLLGVNSSPTTSVGYFTATTVAGFAAAMDRILRGDMPEVLLQRMRVLRNGAAVGVPILNDALYASTNPATTSRYILRVGDRHEEQKSSGVWFSTAAGSTAALRSAGGRVLPPRSRKLAFVVREPYREPHRELRLLAGAVHPGTPLEVVSKMRQSALYLDGSHLKVKVLLGDRVSLVPHDTPLRLLGFVRPG